MRYFNHTICPLHMLVSVSKAVESFVWYTNWTAWVLLRHMYICKHVHYISWKDIHTVWVKWIVFRIWEIHVIHWPIIARITLLKWRQWNGCERQLCNAGRYKQNHYVPKIPVHCKARNLRMLSCGVLYPDHQDDGLFAALVAINKIILLLCMDNATYLLCHLLTTV